MRHDGAAVVNGSGRRARPAAMWSSSVRSPMRPTAGVFPSGAGRRREESSGGWPGSCESAHVIAGQRMTSAAIERSVSARALPPSYCLANSLALRKSPSVPGFPPLRRRSPVSRTAPWRESPWRWLHPRRACSLFTPARCLAGFNVRTSPHKPKGDAPFSTHSSSLRTLIHPAAIRVPFMDEAIAGPDLRFRSLKLILE